MKTRTIDELKKEIERLDVIVAKTPKLEYMFAPRIDRLEWALINHPDNPEEVKKNILRYEPRNKV